MSLTDLQREAHAIAVDRGWYDTEPTFGDLIALVHSELSEALKAHRKWKFDRYIRCWAGWGWDTHIADKQCPDNHVSSKPEGVASELADVVIRVADMAEHYGVDLQAEDRGDRLSDYWKNYKQTMRQQRTFGEWITVCCSHLSQVFDEYTARSRPWEPYIRRFLKEVQAMAAHYGIDLDAAIAVKMKYMRERAGC